VQGFENFLHRAFFGQKRFSLEGTDTMVPMLDEIIREAAGAGARDVLIGMAHRGRLNVLTHVLGKPYEMMVEAFLSAQQVPAAMRRRTRTSPRATSSTTWGGRTSARWRARACA
jgi:2-oxoglutarate dehydrogenase E1 component